LESLYFNGSPVDLEEANIPKTLSATCMKRGRNTRLARQPPE
jgi:hypothetical protein